MKKVKKILSLSSCIEIFRKKEQLCTNWSKNPRVEPRNTVSAHVHTHAHVHKHTRWRCMPAGVIDISKYAMADRSQRVLVRTTTALPTPPRTNAPAVTRLYRTLHPSRTRLGKFSENHVREFPLVDRKSISRCIIDVHATTVSPDFKIARAKSFLCDLTI